MFTFNTALAYTRIAMLIATVLGGTAPAAWAFDSEPATVHIPADGVYLTCHPVLDRSDRDPVVQTSVLLKFKFADYEPDKMTVIHTRFSGQEVNRDDQYTGLGLTKTSGRTAWAWRGVLNRDHRITMMGRVIFNHDGWFYQEIVYKNDYVDHVIPQMWCDMLHLDH